MGESILMYGIAKIRKRLRKYSLPERIQSFVDRVRKSKYPQNRKFVFGKTSEIIIEDMKQRGIPNKANRTAMTDEMVFKYVSHKKREKGAALDFDKYHMLSGAIKSPENIYVQAKSKRAGIQYLYLSTTPYDNNKSIKVIITPNKKIGDRYYNVITSIGIVDKDKMNDPRYMKIK